jgi:phage shock protein PspC (stress-responsive transcriptional regulator)
VDEEHVGLAGLLALVVALIAAVAHVVSLAGSAAPRHPPPRAIDAADGRISDRQQARLTDGPARREATMDCPYCKSENNREATRCRSCASWIVDRPPLREWTRARENRRVAGVCRGLADRFGVPVAALRLLFLGSILLGGWGVLAYLALWVAIPLEALAAGVDRRQPEEPLPVSPGEPLATGPSP